MRQANASEHFIWFCCACEKRASLDFIPRSKIESWVKQGKLPAALSLIPIAIDYLENSPPCEVCGNPDTEYHHWMPQVYFDLVDNFNDWPASYLCRHCHSTWHSLVTFYLPGRAQTDLGQTAAKRWGIVS